jgi:hypothetical protein
VLAQVEDCEEGEGIAFVAVDFDGAAEHGLREDEVGEGGQVEEFVVDVEELAQERLEAMEVDGGLRVKPLEVDINHIIVLVVASSVVWS